MFIKDNQPEDPGYQYTEQQNNVFESYLETSEPSSYNPYPEQQRYSNQPDPGSLTAYPETNRYSSRPEPTRFNEIDNSAVDNQFPVSGPSHQQPIHSVREDDKRHIYNIYHNNRKVDIYPDYDMNNQIEEEVGQEVEFNFNKFNNIRSNNPYLHQQQEYNNNQNQGNSNNQHPGNSHEIFDVDFEDDYAINPFDR